MFVTILLLYSEHKRKYLCCCCDKPENVFQTMRILRTNVEMLMRETFESNHQPASGKHCAHVPNIRTIMITQAERRQRRRRLCDKLRQHHCITIFMCDFLAVLSHQHHVQHISRHFPHNIIPSLLVFCHPVREALYLHNVASILLYTVDQNTHTQSITI